MSIVAKFTSQGYAGDVCFDRSKTISSYRMEIDDDNIIFCADLLFHENILAQIFLLGNSEHVSIRQV